MREQTPQERAEARREAHFARFEAYHEPDGYGVSWAEWNEAHQFNSVVNEIGLDAAKEKEAADKRRKAERDATWTLWHGGRGESLSDRRLYMIFQLLTSRISPALETFLLRFVAGEHPPLADELKEHPLWQGYAVAGTELMGEYSDYKWTTLFGSAAQYEDGSCEPGVCHPRNLDRARTRLAQLREQMEAQGISFDRRERLMRSRRGGYSGTRAIARLLKAPKYIPDKPCKLHPEALSDTRAGQCSECRAVRRAIYQENRLTGNARRLKQALEVAELWGDLPRTKPVSQYSKAARREVDAMRKALAKYIR